MQIYDGESGKGDQGDHVNLGLFGGTIGSHVVYRSLRGGEEGKMNQIWGRMLSKQTGLNLNRYSQIFGNKYPEKMPLL